MAAKKSLRHASGNTRDRILNIALELFVRNGFHGTSIDDIMSKVKMTKGAFYSHFEGKDDLFRNLVAGYRASFLGGLRTCIDGLKGDSLEKIHHAISFLARFAVQNTYQCVFLTFLTAELSANANFEPALRRIYKDYQKIICKLINQGVKEGVLRDDLDPELAALTFMALHDGVLHQWTLNRGSIGGEEFVRTFRQIFVRGVSR